MELEINKWLEPPDGIRERLLNYMNIEHKKAMTPFRVSRAFFGIAALVIILMFIFAIPHDSEEFGAVMAVILSFVGILALGGFLTYISRPQLKTVQIGRTVALGKEYDSRSHSRYRSGYQIFIPLEAVPDEDMEIAQLDLEVGNNPAWDCSHSEYDKINAGDEVLLVRLIYKGRTLARECTYLLSEIMSALNNV